MQKFKRSRTLAIVCLDRRGQPIPGTGIDSQFQIGDIVGDLVGRNDFDHVTAGKQIQRQLSRARMRARNDSCQCHNSCRLGAYSAARLRRRSAAPGRGIRFRRTTASLKRCPDTNPAAPQISEPRSAVLIQQLNGSVQGSRQRCDLLFGPAKIPPVNRLVHSRNHHRCVPGVLPGCVNGMVIPRTVG